MTFLILITVVLFISAFFGLIVKDISISSGNVVIPEPGILMPIFGIHTLTLVLGGFFLLLKKRKNITGVDRDRINYIFVAFIALFFMVLIFNFLFPVVFKNGVFVPFLPIYILIFLGIVTYSIVKHSLFGIKVLLTQAFTVILWLILFSNIVISTSLEQRIINSIVFLASIFSGYLLVKSVIREVEQRQKLEELTTRLQEIDKQKDEFISMAAHELRSPLTAIKGYLSMILEGDAGDITTKAREFLTDTSSVTERLIRLVNNMLNVSRIEEGRMVYQMEEESVIKVAEETYNVFRFEADHRNLEFKLEVPDGLRHIVYVDPDKLREILGNLVSNALKYTNEGSVTIKLSNPTPATVKTEVIDTGPGITVEEQNKLFQKFYRAESTAGKTVGTGLGLYITRLLIEKFSGRIDLSSEPGKGSNFWFEIPVYNQGSEKNV